MICRIGRLWHPLAFLIVWLLWIFFCIELFFLLNCCQNCAMSCRFVVKQSFEALLEDYIAVLLVYGETNRVLAAIRDTVVFFYIRQWQHICNPLGIEVDWVWVFCQISDEVGRFCSPVGSDGHGDCCWADVSHQFTVAENVNGTLVVQQYLCGFEIWEL